MASLPVIPVIYYSVIEVSGEQRSNKYFFLLHIWKWWNKLVFFFFYIMDSIQENEMEERRCNYERYRGLVQNDFANSEYHETFGLESKKIIPDLHLQ